MDIDSVAVIAPEPAPWVLALAPRQAKVVELQYFGGLGNEEIAAVMETSTRTVQRDWQFARLNT